MLADLESIEKRQQGLVRKIKGGDKEALLQTELLKRAKIALEDGKPARTVEIAEDEESGMETADVADCKTCFVCL